MVIGVEGYWSYQGNGRGPKLVVTLKPSRKYGTYNGVKYPNIPYRCEIYLYEYAIKDRTTFGVMPPHELTRSEKEFINKYISENLGIPNFTPARCKKIKEQFEKVFVSNIPRYESWVENAIDAKNRLGLGNDSLNIMYMDTQNLMKELSKYCVISEEYLYEYLGS